jgi:hypothetical protein
MKRAVPAALERFQDSLDELQSELNQAQAVLRRDFAELQADRLKREQAEAAERLRIAAESSAKKNAPPPKEEPAPALSAAAVKQEEDSKEDDKELAQPAAEPEAMEVKDEGPPQISTVADSKPEHDPLFDPTPTTADNAEFDFDAMFADTLGDTSGADNTDAQGDVNMDVSADLNFTVDDSGPSLLRGLEDFAKSDDNAGQDTTNLDLDFAMPDLPDLSTTTQPPPPTTSKPEEDTTTQTQTDNGDSGDLMNTMGTSDLDDLFNMDYENPENTEFDNAFFGFDEN